jgi:hypothetical protein
MMREHKNPIKMRKDLVEKTQKACDALGIEVKISIQPCPDRDFVHYLCGDIDDRMNFEGQIHKYNHTIREEIYGSYNDDTMSDLFMMYFSKNRVAYMKATDNEILEYTGHPDLFEPS